MSSLKEKLTEDLQKAKVEGQLRTERIKEIVKEAVSSAAIEFKEGASEVREIIADVMATVVDNLKDREIKDEIVASIQGAIEGLSDKKRQGILEAREEVRQLEEKIDRREQEIDDEIDSALVNIEGSDSQTTDDAKTTISAAIKAIRESEEVALMQKRYAQLQAQLAILKANIEARYGENYGEVQTYLVNKYLEDAKHWYQESQKWARSESEKSWLQAKQAEFERKIGEVGSALARKERQVLRILKELWSSITKSDSKITEKLP